MKQIEDFKKLKAEILKDYPKLKKTDTFNFGCHSGVSCFNKCCNDVNIFLTPYDILRLKNRLGISSAEFLDIYTLLPIQENLSHPVVMLQMDNNGLNCPFVSDKGCGVYEDRPWSCRMFPIGVASPKEIEGNNDEEFYFLLKEEVCKGFEENKTWTVGEWMADQDVEKYNEFGELFKEISLHNRFLTGKPIEPVKLEMFYMVCYNLDNFRSFLFDSTFFRRFDIEEEEIDKMKTSDEELLRFGFKWLKYALFGEKSLELRKDYFNQETS